MKTKFTRILGILLSTMLVASLLTFVIPVAAADEPGDTQWAIANMPGSTCHKVTTDVADIAVGNDGSRLYVAEDETGGVYKSTNAGQSWSTLSAYPGTTATSIAVAPDDDDVIAVVDGATLRYSKDAGTTWYTLPALPTANTGATITDIAICPARSGTLLGREYVISLADPTVDVVTRGDVMITNNSFTWQTVDSTNVAGARDYMAVIASPNFLGDRSVIALGANATALGTVVVHIVNTATSAQVRAPVALLSTGTTDDYVTAATANHIVAADVAVPIDFDPTSSSGQIVFAGIASTGTLTDNDVYRISGSSSRAMGDGANGVKSVSFSGTTDEGTLFAGRYSDSNVRRTVEPHASSPTWKGTTSPTGASSTVVRVAADFGSTDRVFAGTTGTESAFSISENSGANFWGETFIDNGVGNTVQAIQDLKITPDGESMFMATDDGTQLSVWKTGLPISHSREWSRVYSIAGTTGMLGLNPDWADTPAVYFANVVAAGSIYVSKNGGLSFSTRNTPNSSLVIGAMALESADVVYVGDSASENIYKSNNASWTWDDAVAGKAGNVTSIVVPVSDHVLVGGTSDAAYSTNGGDSFTGKSAGLSSTGALQVAASSDYANDDTFYVGGATTGLVYRWVIGESEEWKSLANLITTGIVGLLEMDGTLYGMSAAACDRTLTPTSSTPSNSIWRTMDAGATLAAVTNFAGGPGSNILYAASSGVGLWAYEDWLADFSPPVTGPSDNVELGIDPVTGRAYDVDLTFEKMGDDTGLVDTLDIQISTEAAGSGGSTSFNGRSISTSSPTLTIQATGDTAGSKFIGFTMKANTIYQWRSRVSDQKSNDAIISQWSPWRTIAVQTGSQVVQEHAGPILLGPMAGAQNVNPALVGFSWAPVAGATEYEVIVATDAALTSTIGGTPAKVSAPSYQVDGLDNGTTYFWSVQSTQPTIGEISIGTFTTMLTPVEEKPAVTQTVTPPTTGYHPITPIAPGYMIAVIIVGAVLVIAVIILIVRTRRIP